MSVDVSWYEESRVVYMHCVGEITFEDLRDSNITQAEMITGGVAPVHTIINSIEATNLGVTSLFKFRSAMIDPNTPNIGWIVMVGGDKFLHFLGNMVAQLGGFDFKVVNTMDEALIHITHNDPTLKHLSPTEGQAGTGKEAS
jgi:hypothetical protein